MSQTIHHSIPEELGSFQEEAKLKILKADTRPLLQSTKGLIEVDLTQFNSRLQKTLNLIKQNSREIRKQKLKINIQYTYENAQNH